MTACRTALLNKALIRSLSRINKDGGIQQASLEAGVASADTQTRRAVITEPVCLCRSDMKESAGSWAALAPVALAAAAELEEVTEELRHDTGTADSGAKVDRGELPERASSQKWVSGEVRQLPGTLFCLCDRLPANPPRPACVLQEAVTVGQLPVRGASDPVEAQTLSKAEEVCRRDPGPTGI